MTYRRASHTICLFILTLSMVCGIVLGEDRASNTIVSLAGQSHYLFIATELEVRVLDVANPAKPVRVAGIPKIQKIEGAFIDGKYLVVIDNLKMPNPEYREGWDKNTYASHLRFYDASDPAHPRLQGQLKIPKSQSNRVAFSGKYAYVLYYDNPSINDDVRGLAVQVIDLSNPSSPTLRGKYHWWGSGEDLVAKNKQLYLLKSSVEVSDREGAEPHDVYGLEILDAKNPDRLSVITSLDLPDIELVKGLCMKGRRACVGTNKSVLCFDVSNPASVTLQAQIYGLKLARVLGFHKEYLLCHAWETDNHRNTLPFLLVVDMRKPVQPLLVWKMPKSEISEMVILEHHAFMLVDGQIEVMDVGDPKRPVTVYPEKSANR